MTARWANSLLFKRPNQERVAHNADDDVITSICCQMEGLSGEEREAQTLRIQADALGQSVQARVRIAELVSAADRKFRATITAADSARDDREWESAEYAYWQALSLYPALGGYWVQYAHMLKEQDKFSDAELHYRTALSLGTHPIDIEEHLSFVCERQNFSYQRRAPAGLDINRPGLARAPTHMDLEILERLFLHRSSLTMGERLDLMRACGTCEEVAINLVEHPDFRKRNRLFLELIEDFRL